MLNYVDFGYGFAFLLLGLFYGSLSGYAPSCIWQPGSMYLACFRVVDLGAHETCPQMSIVHEVV